VSADSYGGGIRLQSATTAIHFDAESRFSFKRFSHLDGHYYRRSRNATPLTTRLSAALVMCSTDLNGPMAGHTETRPGAGEEGPVVRE